MGLIIGAVVGLATSALMLCDAPQYSLAGTVVQAHFGGSAWPLAKWGLHADVGIYIGLIAVVVNLVVVVGITAVLTVLRISPNLDRTRPEDYTGDADREGLDRLDFLLDGVPETSGTHGLR